MRLVRRKEALGIALATFACYTASGCVVERFEDLCLVNEWAGSAFEVESEGINPLHLSMVLASGCSKMYSNKEDVCIFTRRY